MNQFDYANSYKAATEVCTQEAFEQMLDSSHVKDIMAKIAALPLPTFCPTTKVGGDAEGSEGSYRAWKEQVNALKKRLPVLMPHAHFTDGHRHKESAQESQLMSMDFDGIENPQSFWTEKIEPHVDELHIYLAFISPSGKGVKIISQRPSDPSPTSPEGEARGLEWAQKWFAEQVGVEDYDHTHDLARCVYMVGRDSLLYYNPDKLFAEELPSFKVKASTKESNSQNLPLKGDGGSRSYRSIKYDPSRTFRGVLYSDIVKAILQANNGFDEPPVGERHKTLMELCHIMLYICDFDKELMMAVIPRFGKSDSEIADLVRDTLKWRTDSRHYSPYAPKIIKEIISNISNGKISGEELAKPNPFASRPKLPKKLPAILKHICSKVIPEYKPAVLNQAMTALMSHLHDVEFKYINNTCHEPSAMSIVVGPPSIGKGCIVKPIEYITADMKRSDDANRVRQQEWRDSQQSKDEDEKTFEPKDIYITMPMMDMTSPALSDRLDRLNRNGKRVLYWKMNEIEMLNQVSTKEIPTDKIICLAYDRDEYGQERVSAEAVNVSAPLRLNFTASTTEENARQFLKKSLLNGALSRLSFSMVHFMNESDEDAIPMFGDYNDAYRDGIQPCIDRLNDANGVIQSRKVQDLTRELLQWCVSEKYCYEEGPEREVYKELYKRGLRIVFDKAMVLYIMNGYKWDETCSDYIRYSLADDLWCKLYLFSDMMLEQKRQVTENKGVMMVKTKENKALMLYNALPENMVFDKKYIENLMKEYKMKQTARCLIYQLKQYGLQKIDSKHWIKKGDG